MGYKSLTKPFPHQVKEYNDHRKKDARALLWQMRSGKSKAIIDLAEYRFSVGDITGLVIIAPNGVHDNWARRELPRHCSTPYRAAVYRSSQRNTKSHKYAFERLMKTPRSQLAVLCINSETIWREPAKKVLGEFLRQHSGKLMLCVDESHDFRTPGSKRTRTVRGYAKQCKVRRIMTGTSVSNSPLAAWSQFEILEPGALGFRTHAEFKAEYAIYEMRKLKGGKQFSQLVDYRNLDDLTMRISKWASVVLRQDCKGLPDLNASYRGFEMTPEQRKLYDEVKKTGVLDEMDLTGAAKMTKLQQITRGWYYDQYKEVHTVVPDEKNPALIALLDEIRGSQGKVIVWCRFKVDMDKVQAMLQREKINFVIYRGGMSGDAKNIAMNKYMENPAIKVFLGQPQSGGVGLNLAAGTTVIWFSHVFDLIIYEQASERATQVDGSTIDVIHIEAVRSTDQYIISTLADHRDVAAAVTGSGLRTVLDMEELI